ncbi:MAG: urate hydroxylase PuuD [Chitinophagales bacterium]
MSYSLLFISLFALCLVVGLAVIYAITKLSKSIHDVEKDLQDSNTPTTVKQEAKIENLVDVAGGYKYAGLIAAVILVFFGIYLTVQGTPYEGHFREWLNLTVRLIHITFGIAWIGASFYFVFLENSLNRTKGLRDELAGNLWAVHGGGFYYLEKYKLAPKTIPKELHWFKYEAYFTWISGMSLLSVVYYFNAKGFLIDPTVMDISPITAVSLGVGSLIAGWVIYAYLSESALSQNVPLFAAAGLVILTGFAYFYCSIFSARAAFIHFGALLGTMMVGNVFFVIIPAQKEMVRCAKEGIPLDPSLGKNAGWRSLHNNYFTLPVLFTMISNHFPSTFGAENNWVVLIAISIGTAGIKHYLNLIEQEKSSTWVLPISVFILLMTAFITAPTISTEECEEVSFAEVYPIIEARCISCHSSQPTDDVWTSAPNGVMYDTPQQVAAKADLIMQRVVVTKNMPQNNKTGMLPAERNLIRCWINQGALTE